MANITKIYDIKLTGQKELVKDMTSVNKSFEDSKKRFLELKASLGKLGLNSGEVSLVKLEMEKVRLEMLKLRKESAELTNEGKAYTNALRIQKEAERQDRLSKTATVTEYKKLSMEHVRLRNEAKELGATLGTESQEFIEAANKANVLDNKLKEIDSTLGQFGRKVGGYFKTVNIGGISKGVFDDLKSAGLNDILGSQIDRVKGKVDGLNDEFRELKERIKQARESGQSDLNKIENEIIQNRMEADRFNNEIQQSVDHLNGLGSTGIGVFKKMGTDVKQLILGYVGLNAAMNGIRTSIRTMTEMSDQTTNLEIELEKAAGGADKLIDRLAKIDTRTKLVELQTIANIAVKAGTSEENIAGVTEAIDKVKVSFGKDFGEVEAGTETFAKLINIFYEDREITGERILKIGNSIRTLANETVASVPYINDFNGRMAGLRQLFQNFELSDSIGLGAGFEEFKQSAETSSTAIVRILPKLASDTKKFADILKIPQEEFSKLLNENPVQALITVSEKLVKTKGGVEGIAKAFADAELGAGRITTILGTLGGNADVFRERIKRAGETITDTTNIEDAFNKKNENLAATLDKISKKFSDLANNKGFINIVSATGTVILTLITIITSIPFGWWIAMIGFLTLAYWSNIKAMGVLIVTKASLIVQEAILTTMIIYETVVTSAQTAATWLLNTAKLALIVTMRALGISTAALRAAWLFLNSTILATPIGWIVLGIALLGTVASATASSVNKHTDAVRKNVEEYRKQVIQARVNAEIDKNANEATSEKIAKLKVLTRIAEDVRNSDVGRQKAMEELIKIDSRYADAMDGNIIRTGKLRDITDELTASILLQAKAEAAKDLLIQKQKKIIENKLKQDELRPESDKEENVGFGKGAKLLAQSIGKTFGIGDGTATDQLVALYQENNKLEEDVEALAGMVANNKTDISKNKTPDGTVVDPEDIKPDPNAVKNFLNEINALREADLSELKQKKLEGLITEENFLKDSLGINIKYNDLILDTIKGTDAKTRKLRADTASDTIDEKIKTNEALFKIQEEELKQTLKNENAIAQAKLDKVNDDPYSNAVDKAEAEKVYYNEMLSAQTDFNDKMSVLENQLKQNSKKNAEERSNILLKQQSDLNKKVYALSKAQFESLLSGVDETKVILSNSAEIEASKRRMIILNDKSLTQKQKEHELDKVNAALKLATTNIELGSVDAKIKFYEDKLEYQRLTNEEERKYNELLKQRQLLLEGKGVAEQELKIRGIVEIELPSASSLQDRIKSLFTDENGNFIIGQDDQGNDIDGANMLGFVIAQSFDIAQQAMNNYFDAEKLRVEKSKQLAYDRIDLEKRQLLARAQSTAEQESIERQAAEKKKQADKQAGEKLKKIKKNEAKIAFALELANIWSTVFQLGPIAGPIMGAVLTALSIGRLANTMKTIDQAQYGKGGKYGSGGKLTGPPHSNNNGMPVINPDTGDVQAYLEGDEGIINKRSMSDSSKYTVSGTPSQIASRINALGGGVDWHGGASLQKYLNGGPYLGSNVQPPVFRSYYENKNIGQSNGGSADATSERLQRVEELLIQTNTTLSKEVHRKTYVSSRELRDVELENKKQSEIATL